MISVTGSFNADVLQTCVVTLEPFRAHLIDRIDALFAPPSFFRELTHEAPGDASESDMPEPIQNGEIDLGEAVAQQMALALDPYPKKPGAMLELPVEKEKSGAKPFANLAAMIERGQRDQRE
jgi:uncharacterized metal-binding protein YceD (DUF177 family)